jgi:hypothetical protein
MVERRAPPPPPLKPAPPPPKDKQGLPEGVREAFRLVFAQQLTNLNDWIDRIAVKNPNEAAHIMIAMAEFCLPKLQRVEHTDGDGKPLDKRLVLLSDDELLTIIAKRRIDSAGTAEAPSGSPRPN